MCYLLVLQSLLVGDVINIVSNVVDAAAAVAAATDDDDDRSSSSISTADAHVTIVSDECEGQNTMTDEVNTRRAITTNGVYYLNC